MDIARPYLCGDFNYGNINWESHCQLLPVNTHTQLFLDTLSDLFWTQHVTESTRYRLGQSPLILDLVFTNEEAMINNISYLPGLGSSDHVCLNFNLICYVHRRGTTLKKYNIYLADFTKMRQTLETYNWDEALDQLNISEAWDYLYGVFNNLIGEYVPVSSSRNRKTYT